MCVVSLCGEDKGVGVGSRGGGVDITPSPPSPHKRTGLTASWAAQSVDEYGWGWGGGEGFRLGARKIFAANR